RYDGAERVTQSGFGQCWADEDGQCIEPGLLVGDNQVADSDLLARAESRYDFTFDAAQNLTERIFTSSGGPGDKTALKLDKSGRNRPGKIGDVTLKWDANGNLIEKGELRFHYDYRNRLRSVGRQGGDGEETTVVKYEYDAFNRRVTKKVFDGPDGPGKDDTVWSGWQELESYRGVQLISRNIFGRGLDEVVSSSYDRDFDGQLESEWVPVYDHTGNVVALTD
ncbi:MAG: hypothetical protein GY708_18995, partial [Actinomycetia bacterium]|nr:hypothetical protein [Actinomycetes bacterium]